MIWSVDAEVEEVLSDAKAAITSCGDQGSPGKQAKDGKDSSVKDLSAIFSKAMKARQTAEHDKESLTVIVKKFLVRGSVSFAVFPAHIFSSADLWDH